MKYKKALSVSLVMALSSGFLVAEEYKIIVKKNAITFEYNAAGFNSSGIHRDTGTQYAPSGYNQSGWDINGYDINGYDSNGYDVNGYDVAGWDINGYDSNGYDINGYDVAGYDINGYDVDGWDINNHGVPTCSYVYGSSWWQNNNWDVQYQVKYNGTTLNLNYSGGTEMIYQGYVYFRGDFVNSYYSNPKTYYRYESCRKQIKP